MKRPTIYKISLIAIIILAIIVFVCLFIEPLYSALFAISLGIFVVTAIVTKAHMKLENQGSDLHSTVIDEHKDDVKVLDNGEIRYYKSWQCLDSTGKSDEEAKVLTYRDDSRYFHLSMSCYKKQAYKNTFDGWVAMSLLEAKNKGLTLCPECYFDSLSEKEKLEYILDDREFLVVRLTASGNEEAQSTLCYTNVAEYVFIEYDYEKSKFFVMDKYDNRLGALSQATLNKLGMSQAEIENLTCCIYNIDINDNDKFVCDVALVLGEKQQYLENEPKIETKNNQKNTTNLMQNSKKPIFDETIDRCTALEEIKRIDYIGEAIPKNARVVTLMNNHTFSAEDFLAVYGYQVHKTAKMEYYFFLDKSREMQDENGNTIYPAIKITAKTIVHFPDLTTEEAQKYIAISYAERASKNYSVPAEEIDDIFHYRLGRYLYEEYQRIAKSDYCVIDIETTGLDRIDDQIIEISALRVRNDEIIDTFTQLIKPTIPIPASATAINGITNKMVANAPALKEVLLGFVEFVGNDIVVGHNIDRFDLEFINIACDNELGKSFDNVSIDTLQLARSTFNLVSNYQLATLCRELGITQSEHRAEADCISTKYLYDKIKESRKI